MLKLVVLAVLVYQANCFIQSSFDYNDVIKKTEDLVISPFVPEGYEHVFDRASRPNLPFGPGRLQYKQMVNTQSPPLDAAAKLPSSMPNFDEMVIKSLVTDMFGDRDAEILFNHKFESPRKQQDELAQKVSKPSSSWMIEIAEEENSDMQVQDDKKLKQILEILGLESSSSDAKPVYKPTWKNQNVEQQQPKSAEFFSQEFKQYLQEKAPLAPLTQQQQQQPAVLPKPNKVESTWEQLKEKVVEGEKKFLDELIKPQQVAAAAPEKQLVDEKPEEKKTEDFEIDESEWNAEKHQQEETNEEGEEEENDGVEKLVAKQDEVMNAFASPQTAGRIDSSYVFIELGHKIEHDKAVELLHYIAEFSQVPFESFKDLRLNDNLMVFKVEDHQAKLNAWSISNSILTHKLKIWHALGQTVLSSGVGKDLKQAKESNNTVMIIAIVLSISFSLCLAGLIVCCMVRRKSLREQLIAAGDVGMMKAAAAANLKRGRDDEESLIRNGTTTTSNWISYLPFIKRSPQKDQTCGEQQQHSSSSQSNYQRMQSNMISTSIQNEIGAKVSVTPIRVNGQDDE